ncbi:hypothetical protein [Endozoicomonas acroporae]|uniref:hypothetical protein n=1 Tax=Endozoicomonas acroporae TaxID=1701104 RepID=UPI0013D07055|nr:hypothetical protein [Endozoicomonas acroporae]
MGAYNNAVIVAARIRRTSRSVAATAGHRPVSAEAELFKWLDEKDELEKQHVLQQLFKKTN